MTTPDFFDLFPARRAEIGIGIGIGYPVPPPPPPPPAIVAHIPDVDEGPRTRLVALLPLCSDRTVEALLWHAREHLRAIQGIDCDAENKSG